MRKATVICTVLITLLLVIQHPSASGMKLYNLPNHLLFTSKEIASGSKIFLLLTCIETQAQYSESAEDFLQYLIIYDRIINAWRPYFFNVNSPLESPERCYSDTKQKLKSITKIIAHNDALAGNDTYHLYLNGVIMKIIDGFGLNYQKFEGCYTSIKNACCIAPSFGKSQRTKPQTPQK